MADEKLIKNTYLINTVILLMVFALMAFFKVIDVPFLVKFSIPTAFIYLIGYYLIHSGKLTAYVWIVYIWLTLYMCVTTVCLGYGFGFHLYCMSMIPIMFITEYFAFKNSGRSVRALHISLGVAAAYLITTGSVSFFGPVYDREGRLSGVFWLMNSFIVVGFLIFYNNWMTRLVIDSEKKLIDMAHNDKLTGLYNRHYMMEVLDKNDTEYGGFYLAMVDIDFFKKINDTYGHNAGDYVLGKLADILRRNCAQAYICRWGGEEFLILGRGSALGSHAEKEFEKLRKTVEDEKFEYDGKRIRVTVTIGLAFRQNGETIDSWINHADEKLYIGKNGGRNRVVV